MAEVFGLAAGVLQVAGFGAEVSSTLFKCAKKFHNASKELDEIASQVETTSVSLRRVDSLLKDPTTKALHTQKLYDDTMTVSNGCFEVFRELDDYVKSFEPTSSFGEMALRSKARWLFDSGKVQGLGQVLRRYCDVLHLDDLSDGHSGGPSSSVRVLPITTPKTYADWVFSTKDELQALETDLKLLALSNKDLSHSNKTLTDTIALISRASVNPVVPKATTPPAASTITDGRGISRALPVTSLIAMPSVNLPPIVPRKQNPSDRVADHLQRCMQSVQELATTISCALDALHGREKTGNSDIHGSYAKLVADVQKLTSKVQCVHCKRRVAWPHLEPIKSDPGQAGACICMRVASPSTWEPCHDQLLSDPNHPDSGNAQHPLQIQGHQLPQVALSIKDDSAFSKVIQPSDIPMDAGIRKRSFSKMAQEQPPPHMQITAHHSPASSSYETSPDGAHEVHRMVGRGDPPQAHDGRYYCNFGSECADQYFDRKCEWRQV
jgi:CRP-like cAMP-binding protein